MKVHSGTPLVEFLADVRDRACRTGAPPAVIDKLDELLGLPAYDAEIEKLDGELYDTKKDRDDLYEELQALYDAVVDQFNDADLPGCREPMNPDCPIMRAVADALARHKS